MHLLDFNDVQAFVLSVEEGGFSAAARRLNLSRSAVGRAVARLEQRLGACLVHRTTRQITLTSDGAAFLTRCERALAELRAGQAELDISREQVGGRVRMSVPVLFGRMCVGPVLAGLAERHPALELQVEFSDRVVDLVAGGFDLAVRNGDLGDAAGLIQRRLLRERALVCAAPSYLARFGEPARLDDLPTHHAVVYARGDTIRPWLFPQADGRPLEITPPSRLQLDDLGAIADAAAAGLGLAWLPSWLVAGRLDDHSLVSVLGHATPFMRGIHAVWPAAPSLPLRVRVTLDALVEELRRPTIAGFPA